jgi:hypothetical protein
MGAGVSFKKTYLHTLLVALDQFGAAVFFNRADLTVSAMCWLVRKGRTEDLRPGRWQTWLLVHIGNVLEWVQPGHLEAARVGDLIRANSVRLMLVPGAEAKKSPLAGA